MVLLAALTLASFDPQQLDYKALAVEYVTKLADAGVLWDGERTKLDASSLELKLDEDIPKDIVELSLITKAVPRYTINVSIYRESGCLAAIYRTHPHVLIPASDPDFDPYELSHSGFEKGFTALNPNWAYRIKKVFGMTRGASDVTYKGVSLYPYNSVTGNVCGTCDKIVYLNIPDLSSLPSHLPEAHEADVEQLRTRQLLRSLNQAPAGYSVMVNRAELALHPDPTPGVVALMAAYTIQTLTFEESGKWWETNIGIYNPETLKESGRFLTLNRKWFIGQPKETIEQATFAPTRMQWKEAWISVTFARTEAIATAGDVVVVNDRSVYRKGIYDAKSGIVTSGKDSWRITLK
jgi:hypothetical protein